MTRRGLVELAAGLAIMVALVVVAGLWGSPRGSAGIKGASAFEVTRAARLEPAPTFRLADLAGRPVDLASYRGRVVLLNFWATWCAPCRDEIPAIEALARELEGRGLSVLAVNHQEPAAAVGGFVRRYGLTLPVLLDPRGEVGERYHVVALPATFLIDPRGSLVGAALGFRDWSGPAARTYLEELLSARS